MFDEMINFKKDLVGIFHLDIIKNGELVATEDYNLIVDSATHIMAKLLGGVGNNANIILTKLHYGTENAPAVNPKTALGGTVFIKDIASVDYDAGATPNEIKFNFGLDITEFNGNDIWQFAIGNTDSELFSMISRNPTKSFPIEKEDDVEIIGWWKFRFTNS